MNTITMILTAAALILTMVLPFAIFYFGERSRRRFRRSLTANIVSFFGVLLIATIVMLSGTVTVHAAQDAGSISTGMGYIAAALVTGISGIGSGIAVASSASAALGALSENESLFGKSIIFVAMAEGIALYGLIISFMILGAL